MVNRDCALSIILPTFNERGNLQNLLEEIQNATPGISKEVIIVDDNSPDGTFTLAKELAEKNSEVKAICRTGERGLGRSIREGLENSSGFWLVVMDADLSHAPRYLPRLCAGLADYDCVAASRFLEGGTMNPRWRYWLSYLSNRFVCAVTRVRVSDSQYGFFAIRRSVLFSLPFNRIFWGYGDYSIRLFHYFELGGYRATELAVENAERRSGQSKTVIVRVFFRYLYETLRLRLVSSLF